MNEFKKQFLIGANPIAVIAIMSIAMLPPLLTAASVFAGVTIQDISPNESELYKASSPAFTAANSSGGRVNNLASVAGSNQNLIFYAASEWGGLFKSVDGGRNWDHLDGHVPVVMEDVAVAVDQNHPNSNVIYATSRYDGRVQSRSGIEVSYDEGVTWNHPDTAVPLPGFNTPLGFNCAQAAAIGEPAAFGIGIRPDAPETVVIGTNCGVAISNDSGATWRFIDPTPSDPATTVWDVVVHAGGIIDVCGDDGHWRSQNGGTDWTGGGLWWIPGNKCSIVASPDESQVIFITALVHGQGHGPEVCIPTERNPDPYCYFVYESDNGGGSWYPIGVYGRPPDSVAGPKNRIPFVVTNKRSDSAGLKRFDLWFGDEGLFRVSCQSPPKAGSFVQQRCDPPSAWFPVPLNVTYHGDMGDVEFDPRQSTDACPVVVASDGGTFYLDPDDPAITNCQNPQFKQPDHSVHALWLWGMDGANQSGDAVDLYFGAQDDGPWETGHAETQDASATWRDDILSVGNNGGDAESMAADQKRLVYWFQSGGGLRLQEQAITGSTTLVPLPPDCKNQLNQFAPAVARYADKKYVILCPSDQGVYTTQDITAANVQWIRLDNKGDNLDGCGIRASISPTPPGEPVFYLQKWLDIGDCLGNEGNGLYKYDGDATGQTWQRIDTNPVIDSHGTSEPMSGGIGIFGVDQMNADRLYASNLRSDADGGPRMVYSDNGGAIWHVDPALDRMMTQDGAFKYRNNSGPTSGTPGYPQPSLVAFDPFDTNIVVAAGRDSGIFLSTNGGRDWGLLTDPIDPGSSKVHHIPRTWFAHFHHNSTGTIELYLGTQGRGVWRISIRLPVADAGGPYTTLEGVNVSLAGSGSDPDGKPVTFAWDLDNDGMFETVGQNAVFDQVGQDGVYTVRLKVTADGVSSVATTTVTVSNVAPVVTLSSDAPKNENSAVTVSGLVSDPGWLDPLTATVDWGDATPVQPITGVIENVRPDATLTFSVSHTYGDNGTFSAKVCGKDDDTTTCQTVALSVTNVNPTATIDQSGTVPVNGVPTIIVHAGQSVPFAGRSQDPGSDDLTLTWEWDDGTPNVITTSLVNPPNPDPLPSPSIQPRDVTDTQSHAFGHACLYKGRFTSRDDDTGTGQDEVEVVVIGNALEVRSAGYWQTQFSKALGKPGKADLTPASLACYLQIVGYMSTVFQEVRDASTVALAFDVLFQKQNGGSAVEHLDRQLLTAWLNFANGAMALTQLVDTNGNGVPDTPFVTVMSNAETVRLNPSATKGQLENQKDILEGIDK
jgi:PKD domain